MAETVKMLSAVGKFLCVMVIFRFVICENDPACRICDIQEIVAIRSDLPPCCGRSVNEKCGRGAHCLQGLTCRFPYRRAPIGYCKVPTRGMCGVQGPKFNTDEKHELDCRTHCICMNGTYSCSTKCPHEKVVPRGACDNPRLISVPGRCCRQWLCDTPPEEEPRCEAQSSAWGDCSAGCGGGVAHRSSNDNAECAPRTETRFCQTSSCKGLGRYIHRTAAENHFGISLDLPKRTYVREEINLTQADNFFINYKRTRDLMSSFPVIHKHPRRHACKTTRRTRGARLRLGPCVSTKVFRPRLCGRCVTRNLCSKPVRSTTVQIEMRCGSLMINEDSTDIHKLLMEYMVSGQDIWEQSKKAKRTAHRARHERHRFSLKKELKPYMFNESSEVPDYIPASVFRQNKYNNVHFVNMQMIAKCKCSEKYCKQSDDYDIIEKLSLGEVQLIDPAETFENLPILHRVHRTARPIGN